MNIAEQAHVVNILAPIDITGGATVDIFSMKDYGHASIIVSFGSTASAATKITIEECTAANGDGNTAIAHYIYKEETDGGDVLGARTAVLSAGTTPPADDNIFYVIELDSDELSNLSHFVKVTITAPAATILCSAIVVLTQGRRKYEQSATVLT